MWNEMETGEEEKDSFTLGGAEHNESVRGSAYDLAVFKALTEESEVSPRSSFRFKRNLSVTIPDADLGPGSLLKSASTKGTAWGLGGVGTGMGSGMGVSGLDSSTDTTDYPTPSSTPVTSRSRANSDTPLFELQNPDSGLSSAYSSSMSYPAAVSSPHPTTRSTDGRRTATSPSQSLSLSQSLSPRAFGYLSPRPSHGMQLVSAHEPEDLPVHGEDVMDLDIDHGLKRRVRRLLAASPVSLVLGLLGAALVSVLCM